MKDSKLSKGGSVVVTVLALLIFLTVKFSNQLQDKNMILPVVVLVFVLAFGFFGFQVIKLWKQSDEEILDIPPGDASGVPPTSVPSFLDRLRFFLCAIAFVLFVLFKDLGKNITTASIVFSCIVLVIACIYFLPALIQKLRGKENEPLFRAKLRPENYIGMLFGLFGVCFSVFFCYIVITKAPWFIALPFLIPPLIIGGAFARPLVAGLRILFRKERDPGEKHINKRKTKDPWDRPDRKL